MEKNSSLVSDSEATVFIDTSLGTHMAVAVHHNDTVSALKRKIEYEHQLCFTSMGKITVEALKVKRNGYFYHLSDSMFVKNAFSRVNKNWFLSADASDVPRKRLSNFDGSIPLLLEGSEHGTEKVTGSVDYARETSKDWEIGVKHSDNDHCTTSFHERISRPEPEIQEDLSLCTEGYRVPTTQECKEAIARKESDVQGNVSLEKGSPAEKQKQRKTKQRDKETVHLKENDASVHGFGEEKLQPDIIPPENSLGNQSRDVSCDMKIGNKNTTEEPCRSSASNRSDSGIHSTNDASKETEVPGKPITSRKNTSVEDASQSQPAIKKKRKFESISGLEDSSNGETSKPDIAEFSLGDKQKNEDAIVDGLTAESSDLLTNSSGRRKKKMKKSSSSLNQVVAAGINNKNSGGEDDVASVNEQGLQGLTPPEFCGISLKQNEVHSSVDINKTTDAGNMESKTGTAEEILDDRPRPVFKVPSEVGTDLAERVRGERESSERKDSESVMSEKDKLPGQDKRDGNDTNVIVTSELLDTNGTVTPNKTSKKKKKTRKTKDTVGETQILSGAERIKDSEHGISLDVPHEAVVGDHACDKAREEESNRSQKNGKDVSERETESSHFVRKTDNVDGNEVGALERIAKPQENAESKKQNIKKKSKRKHSAITKNIENLQAEAQDVGHQDPAETTDNRTEGVAKTRKKNKLEKTTAIEQSNEKALESDKVYGIETNSVLARSNSTIESTKVLSHAQEHISDGRPLEAKPTGNPQENRCSDEADSVMEISSEGNKVSSYKHLVPSQNQLEVASGAVHAEGVTRTDSADNEPKAIKKRKKLENKGIVGKPEACNSSSIQPQGSLSKGDGIMPPPPEKKVPKKAPKSGSIAPSSDTSHTTSKMNSVSEAAGKCNVPIVSGTNTHAEKKNEALAVSNSNLENSNNKVTQNKMVNKRQSGLKQNHLASGKASGIDYGEVVNRKETRKSLAPPREIFKDDSSGSSEDEGDVSEASTCMPSDYSSSSSYSDEESNAETSTPKDGKSGGRSVIKSCSSNKMDLKFNILAKGTSSFKKAKLIESQIQSQLEDDGENQPDEVVPDCQPIS